MVAERSRTAPRSDPVNSSAAATSDAGKSPGAGLTTSIDSEPCCFGIAPNKTGAEAQIASDQKSARGAEQQLHAKSARTVRTTLVGERACSSATRSTAATVSSRTDI
jgi:hypothetical protein